MFRVPKIFNWFVRYFFEHGWGPSMVRITWNDMHVEYFIFKPLWLGGNKQPHIEFSPWGNEDGDKGPE